ncbi:MAG TPA: hypothetical protein VHF90_03705 [Thermoleophilaceae bacterium]|nr:hypothetical protein [Thermoleophilaceae bacterium]
MANATARTDIGFQGGQVLSLRTADDAYRKLMDALGNDAGARWHALELDDELLQLDLSQVVYVRRETGNRAVGF